jgi:hypothetical protein
MMKGKDQNILVKEANVPVAEEKFLANAER